MSDEQQRGGQDHLPPLCISAWKDINACYQRYANAYMAKPTDLSQ
ncbi:hypothetical protein [Dyadobacter sp. CY343]|nr:hypothetical protein [Dyadobacter sp. CY343]